ncbi:hypothetical protein, partial [uncultured Boseongicola sp.]|uniref:hypothetical protein n=1 Tax=uncultured Boseongicola sp. TaxID=1648499 RepID=UPI00262AC686
HRGILEQTSITADHDLRCRATDPSKRKRVARPEGNVVRSYGVSEGLSQNYPGRGIFTKL